MLRILGYADRLSAAPGGRLQVKVSCEGVSRYRAELRRIIQGDINPDGPGYRDEKIDLDLGGPFAGRRQEIHAGSYGLVERPEPLAELESFTLAVAVAPTLPEQSCAILSHRDPESGAGFALTLEGEGGATLTVGGERGETSVSAGRPMFRDHWYVVVAGFDPAAGRLHIEQLPLRRYAGAADAGADEVRCTASDYAPAGGAVPLLIAAVSGPNGRPRDHFNGRIEGPRIYREAVATDALFAAIARGESEGLPKAIAAWDFAQDIPSLDIRDSAETGLDGRLINLPARGVTGIRWSGARFFWQDAPEEYGAIHFHDDDLYDAGWETDFELSLPEDLRSGVYAVRLVDADLEDAEPGPCDEYYVTFCVRPKPGQPRNKAVFLLPTASYLAYANHRLGLDVPGTEVGMGRLVELSPHHLHLQRHPELAYSFYEVHNDGSGVFYSSRLRPIVDLQPKVQGWLGGRGSGLWQFNADTHILGWLEQAGVDYDVVTDEDLHAEGLGLIEGYGALLTGSHPEYYSTPMLDALEAYTEGGGRLMYLGGNGFYWRIAFSEAAPGAIECRRSEDGIRPWDPGVGNYYHSFTGEYGGLWRRIGRAPNRLAGVGMTSQGFDVSEPYRVLPAARDPRASFIFEGVDGEIIGDFGLSGGGAAGLEVDRADVALGTPPHALVLATSQRHTGVYLMTPEDMLDPTPDIGGMESELIRADLTFFETAGGGAVFSTGSIAWAGAMACNGYDNEIATITGNVLRRFLDPMPFPPPGERGNG